LGNRPWHRVIGFGTIGPVDAVKYNPNDQPLGTAILMSVIDVNSILWWKEIWVLMQEGNVHVAQASSGEAQTVAQTVQHNFNKAETFPHFWKRMKKKRKRIETEMKVEDVSPLDEQAWRAFVKAVGKKNLGIHERVSSAVENKLKECKMEEEKQ
jgi:hypothetical protein